MTMEQTILIAGRLRELDDHQFMALRRMVVGGDEPQDETTLASVCEALADCTEIVRQADHGAAREVAHA